MAHRLGVIVVAIALVVGAPALPSAAHGRTHCGGETVGAGTQRAEICRDAAYGVPSVYANDMPGVWFGTGWAQVEDRLFQIELVRRNARGSLAELFGSLDASTIQEDERSRTPESEFSRQYGPRAAGSVGVVARVAYWVVVAIIILAIVREARPFRLSRHDPLKLHAQWLLSEGVADQATLDAINAELTTEMDAAVEFAVNAPYPDPSRVDEDVYA